MLLIITALVLAIGGLIAVDEASGIRVKSVEPDPATELPSTESIRITFSEPMDAASVQTHFRISPEVAGSFAWEGSRLTFDPPQPLLPDRDYQITLAKGARSLAGRQTKSDFVWKFHTRAPGVLYLSPADTQPKSLWAWSQKTDSASLLYSTKSGVEDFAPSVDGTQIALSVINAAGLTDIWLIDANGENARLLINCMPAGCYDPVWSPDQRLLAYERYEIDASGLPGSSRVWLYDFETKQTAPLFEDNQILGINPLWSPSGDKIAFYDLNEKLVRVVRLGTGEENTLPSSSDEMGAFSPDGLSIAYPGIGDEDNNDVYQLWLQSLDKAESTLLLETSREIANVVWSPNGRWIAFEAWHDRVKITGDVKLVVFDMEAREMQEISCCDTFGFMDLQWNPTGDRLLVRLTEAYPSSATQIMIYNVETGKSELVAENGVNARWLP